MSMYVKDGAGNTTEINTIEESGVHTPVHCSKINLADRFTAGGLLSIDVGTDAVYVKAPVAAEDIKQVKTTYDSLLFSTCTIYEDPTVTVDGTAVLLNRNNRFLSDASNIEVYSAPTVTDNGTIVTLCNKTLDLLLSNDKTYLIVFESFDASNKVKWQIEEL